MPQVTVNRPQMSQYEKDKNVNIFRAPLFYIELICNLWFSFEFLMRLLFAPNRKQFVQNPINIVDLVATASFFADWALIRFFSENQDSLEFLNIVRVLRLFKLAQHSSGLKILIQTFKASARVRFFAD